MNESQQLSFIISIPSQSYTDMPGYATFSEPVALTSTKFSRQELHCSVYHHAIIETANKIIDKLGKSVMSYFFTNCSDLCQ